MVASRFGTLLTQLSSAREELIATSEAEITKRSEQLDAALSNMSQGLCMFNGEGRLVLSNPRFREIYSLDEESVPNGVPVRDLLRASMEAGNHSEAEIAQIEREMAAHLAQNAPKIYVESIREGRMVAVSRVPLAKGGWVTTFEDITERKEAEAKIEHMAHHDALTGLPNRVLFRHVWTAPAWQVRFRGPAFGRSRPCMRRLICS